MGRQIVTEAAAQAAGELVQDDAAECVALRELLQFTWMVHFIPENTKTTQLRTAVEKVIRKKTTAVLAVSDLRMRGVVIGLDRPLNPASGSLAPDLEDIL